MRKVQFILLLGLALCVASCRTQREPIIETRTEVQYETKYVERLVRDTLWVDVPAETATNVTPADSSHIETNLAASDAWVDPQGLLHHTLNNKAQSGQAEMSVHGFYEKVLNLRYEDRRCNMDVPPGGDGRTV